MPGGEQFRHEDRAEVAGAAGDENAMTHGAP